ncbi:MAG: MFS transporter [Sulfobacillus acidophilus]|uniref:MFS transporter n=1 Tax=Sulfobacillus acidophilus TaxID=53633 RepID=A0A2T2WP99_9FIRM|nr:MAG: MFS transporter [Sulfobacillus acidophilus]
MRPNFRILSIYLIGIFIGALDTSIISPVFPLIMRTFHVRLEWVAWTVTAYTVAYIASTVLAGAWGDRLGHKQLFLWGVAAFMLASALAAVSFSFWMFMVARVIQGAGAGAVYPNAQAEGVQQFPAERRGLALGLFGAVFGLASVLGPTLGGVLGQYLGWPAVFWVNVPIALLVLVQSGRIAPSQSHDRAMPDWQGGAAFSALLASVLLVVMVPGLILRGVFAVVALLALALFVWRERRAVVPFLDPVPLRNRSGVAMMIGAALIGLDMSAAVFVPTLVQRELHFSVLDSGLALLPAAFSGAVLAGAGGVLVDRVGPRKVLMVGLVAGAAGGLLLALPGLGLGRFVVAMLCFGLGTAFTMGAPLNRMVLALYRENQSGEALSVAAVFRGMGLAAGPIILTAVEAGHGFGGMFGTVMLASLVGVGVFVLVPDVKVVGRRQVLSES